MKMFLRSNVAFVVWLVLCMGFYMLLFHRALGVLAVVVIFHLISLIVAFSPVGEWLMRQMNGVRKVEILSEAGYINPLFAEVYYEASKLYPKISGNVQVFIKDEATINAYAFGTNSIVLSRGALEMLDEDQLKGMLAHEFGHLVSGDTKMLLALTIGNGFFGVIYAVMGLLVRILDFFIQVNLVRSIFSLFHLVYVLPLKSIRFVLVKIILLMQLVSALLIGLGGRNNQFRADEFACEMGYGEHLLSALYLLHEMNMIDDRSWLERLKAGSPLITRRIARLERA